MLPGDEMRSAASHSAKSSAWSWVMMQRARLVGGGRVNPETHRDTGVAQIPAAAGASTQAGVGGRAVSDRGPGCAGRLTDPRVPGQGRGDLAVGERGGAALA